MGLESSNLHALPTAPRATVRVTLCHVASCSSPSARRLSPLVAGRVAVGRGAEAAQLIERG